jgi:hypothetical protein
MPLKNLERGFAQRSLNLAGDKSDRGGIDSEVLVALNRFAAQFEQNPLVYCFSSGFRHECLRNLRLAESERTLR